MDDDLVGESAFHYSSGTEIINAFDVEVCRGDERSKNAPPPLINIHDNNNN